VLNVGRIIAKDVGSEDNSEMILLAGGAGRVALTEPAVGHWRRRGIGQRLFSFNTFVIFILSDCPSQGRKGQ
jgi:hypothetical protein